MNRDQGKPASPRLGHLKRPLSPVPAHEDGGGLAFRGPGGGAIEGPPLLGRMSAGSAHGGLQYYRCALGVSAIAHGELHCLLHWFGTKGDRGGILHSSRGESVHGGANALMAGRRSGSAHGGSNYWRIMRAAATAAKWRNREGSVPI